MNTQTLTALSKYLNKAEMGQIRHAAAEVQTLEAHWRSLLDRKFKNLTDYVLAYLQAHGKLPPASEIDFLDFYVEHSFSVMQQGFETAYSQIEKTRTPPSKAQLAKPFQLPRSLGDLMKLWDHYRKKKVVPKRQKLLAEKVKKAYIRKLEKVWAKESAAFASGDTGDQYEAYAAIRKASYASYARAKMIVETETTYHYNRARREVYDESPDVTHYLFLAIRDHATTHWCKTRNGVVYKKGSAVLDRETPPIHWNCRSEIIPLVWNNPRHRALMQNRSLWRENRSPAPLPEGWNRRSA